MFLKHLSQTDRVSSEEQYKYLLNRFVPLLPHNCTWYNLTLNDLQIAVSKLRNQGLRDSSISVMTRALRTLWSMEYDKGNAPSPPSFNLKLRTNSIPEYLSRNEIKKMLKLVGKYESIDVWVLLYLFRGMNFKDLALLRKDQVMNNRIYYSRSKTGKEVPSFPLHQLAKNILYNYKRYNSNYLMPYLSEDIHKTFRSKENRIRKVRKQLTKDIKYVFKELNIKSVKRPFYTARYTFALHLSEHPNQDLFQIKRALGHQSIVTTERYIMRLNMSDLDDYIEESIVI